MSGRRWRRFGCLLATVACLGLFVQSRKLPPDTPSSFPGYEVHERQTVGLRFSPWAEYVRRNDARQNGEVVEESKEDWRIIATSLSWLLLMGAIGSVVAFRRLRPIKATDRTTGEEAVW